VKRLGGIHGVLAGHRVHNEQDFMRLRRFLDRSHFLHHLFIDVQATCGVDDDRVPDIFPGIVDGVRRNFDRALTTLGVNRNVQLLAEGDELIDCRRAMNICCDQKRIASLTSQVARKFGRKRRLPGTLKAGDENNRGWCLGGPDFRLRFTQQLGHFVKDDLDDQLARRDAVQDFLAEGPFLNIIDELLGDLVVYIRI